MHIFKWCGNFELICVMIKSGTYKLHTCMWNLIMISLLTGILKLEWHKKQKQKQENKKTNNFGLIKHVNTVDNG